MHGNRDPDAGVGTRELFEHEDVREESGARAAVLFGNADAEQSKPAKPGEQRRREPVVAIPLTRVWRNLSLGKLAREHLNLALLWRKLEVHNGTISAGD